MKRPLTVLASAAMLALGVLVAGGVAAADPTVPPLPGSAPLPDPTLPVPVPTESLPIPGPSGTSGSPSPAPTGLPTGPAVQCPKTTGTSIQFCFTYGNDRTAWYWADQQYQNISVGPANQQLTLPSPQSADTLPMTVRQGELNRVAAMYFDLVGHGVPLDATVTKFLLKVQEGATPTGPEEPEYNAADQVVLACPATKIWAATQADVWSAKPTWSETGCVEGAPDDATPPVWTFDLTPLATEWATNPYASNNGIVLLPKSSDDPQGGNYQVNFKIPSRDDSTTTDLNEYDSTKDRVLVEMTYANPAGPPSPKPTHSNPPPTSPPTNGGGGSGGGGTGTTGGGGGFGGGSTGGGSTCCDTGTGSTDTGGGSGTITGGSDIGTGDTGSGPAPAPQAEPASVPTVRFPWYVWILLPIGLLAVAAVRSILFERAGGVRPGGVIASIRARNAAARGESSTGSGVVDRIRRIAPTRRPTDG